MLLVPTILKSHYSVLMFDTTVRANARIANIKDVEGVGFNLLNHNYICSLCPFIVGMFDTPLQDIKKIRL